MCNLSCSTVVSLKEHKSTKYFWSKLTLIQNNWLCSQSLLWLLTLGHLTITQTVTWHCILNTESLIQSRSLLAAITAFTPLGRHFTRFWSISVELRASVPVHLKGVGWCWVQGSVFFHIKLIQPCLYGLCTLGHRHAGIEKGASQNRFPLLQSPVSADVRLACSCSAMETHFMKLLLHSHPITVPHLNLLSSSEQPFSHKCL